jgi:dTDP-4-dehydrorhamnose 3,5-epimerase
MNVLKTKLDGILVLEPKVLCDQRGFFMESFNKEIYKDLGIENFDIQDNHSLSIEAGILRGLHYQIHPKAQSKLIRVLTGAIYDVVVDIRQHSLTFGRWEGIILSEYNKRQILVPKGFAHGFCTLVPNTQVFYKVDEYYSPAHEKGIAWNDPQLGITWPTSNPILSDKDGSFPFLRDSEINFF